MADLPLLMIARSITGPCAQTVVQLYAQILRAGYSDAEMTLIRDAYELAMELVPGRIHPSRKLYIAHGLGTASILASHRVPGPVVAAGLIHNIYSSGDFGDGTSGISTRKREEVRAALGEEVEAYLAAFASFLWNIEDGVNHETTENLRSIRDRCSSFDAVSRAVLLIQLAELLEKHLDREIFYFGGLEKAREYLRRNGDLIADIARRLGFPSLATELSVTFQETLEADAPEDLQDLSRRLAFVVPPSSYRRRLSVAMRGKLRSRLFSPSLAAGSKQLRRLGRRVFRHMTRGGSSNPPAVP